MSDTKLQKEILIAIREINDLHGPKYILAWQDMFKAILSKGYASADIWNNSKFLEDTKKIEIIYPMDNLIPSGIRITQSGIAELDSKSIKIWRYIKMNVSILEVLKLIFKR